MRLEEIDFDRTVQGAACFLLLAAGALFGYELRKPPIAAAAPAGMVNKQSALAAPSGRGEQWNRLPALPERYQRKKIFLVKARKSFLPGKTYASREAGVGSQLE